MRLASRRCAVSSTSVAPCHSQSGNTVSPRRSSRQPLQQSPLRCVVELGCGRNRWDSQVCPSLFSIFTGHSPESNDFTSRLVVAPACLSLDRLHCLIPLVHVCASLCCRCVRCRVLPCCTILSLSSTICIRMQAPAGGCLKAQQHHVKADIRVTRLAHNTIINSRSGCLELRQVRALRQRLRVVEGTVALVRRVLRQHDVGLRLELVAHEAVLQHEHRTHEVLHI